MQSLTETENKQRRKKEEGFNRQHSRPSEYVRVHLVLLTLEANLNKDLPGGCLGEQKETALIESVP